MGATVVWVQRNPRYLYDVEERNEALVLASSVAPVKMHVTDTAPAAKEQRHQRGGARNMPIRVAVPLPGPFVWTPRGRSGRRSGGGGDGASGEELLVGFFIAAIVAGWIGIYYAFTASVPLGVLSILADLAWLVLLARAWLWVLKDDDIDDGEKTAMTAVVAFFAIGLPVLWLNAMAWWIPPLGVAANLGTIAVVVSGARAYRRWEAAQHRIAEAEADAAEVAAIQAEIDAQEAELARLRRVVPPQPRRWAPPGYAQRDEALTRNSQGFRMPPPPRRG